MNFTTEVIICTYNGAAFVVEQLDSILKQTTTVNKISIYDDHSPDDTVLQIHNFLNQLPPDQQCLFTIQVNSVNLGYALNFISAIKRSTKDILFLCDQDDIWERDKVEVILSLFHNYNPDMVFSDGSLINQYGRKLDKVSVLESYGLNQHLILQFRNSAFKLLTKRNYINGAAAAIRRVAAQNALPLPCDMPHDYWLAIWCSLHNGIVATPKSLYRYRQHQTNVIGMGSSNPLYIWLGIWRQPNAPRERELRIWKAVTDRIESLPCQKEIEYAHCKLNWLSHVITNDKKNLLRALEILKSALNGNYRSYSSSHALLRDIVSLIKS
ncbi:MAG: glycosyltransferase [Candidatus Competibacteraceae bacterium]|nr:glycosyltransferase [Candidatus Competibacteraceae bacterium]